MEIFEKYAVAGTLEAAVNMMLGTLDSEADLSLSNATIETIIRICRNNNYANIEDLEWFVNTVLGKLLLIVKNSNTASLLSYTLIVLIKILLMDSPL